jgi:hypothetical protein
MSFGDLKEKIQKKNGFTSAIPCSSSSLTIEIFFLVAALVTAATFLTRARPAVRG